MHYLTAKEVLVMHARIIDVVGGAHGVRDVNLFASLIEKPKMKFGGKELYQGILKKTAVYCEALATYHVFIDGNKRTALAASARFLALNGYLLTATNREAEEFVMGVALKKYDVDAMERWLEHHVERR